MTPAGRFRRASPHPRPPEPQRPWDADVRWEQESGSGHFLAVACSADGGEAELLRSEPIPWPPTTDGAQAMKQAVEAIDATLLEAGWQPRPKGDAWYARRYAWAPEQPAPSRNGSAPAAVGVSARREAAPRPRARAVAAPETTRRRRAPSPSTAADPWTDAALQLTGLPQIPDAGTRWSCRIRWNAGWRSSRFEAVAMPPGRKRGPRIATSTEFQWTFKADPDPALPAVRAAVAALRSELLAAGWEPAGIGRQWYAHRFVWTGDGDPPDAVSGGGSPAA